MIKKSLLFLPLFLLFACSSEKEDVSVKIRIPIDLVRLDVLEGELKALGEKQGYSILEGDKKSLSVLNEGNPAFSLWFKNGKKIAIFVVTTTDKARVITLMFFKSGFADDEDLMHTSRLFYNKISGLELRAKRIKEGAKGVEQLIKGVGDNKN